MFVFYCNDYLLPASSMYHWPLRILFQEKFYFKNKILANNFLLLGSESWVQRSCRGRVGKVSESNASRGSGINMWNNKLQTCRVNKQNN